MSGMERKGDQALAISLLIGAVAAVFVSERSRSLGTAMLAGMAAAATYAAVRRR